MEAKAPPDRFVTDETIQKTRDCDRFTPWKPGCDPKEHADMLAVKQLQDFQAEQRERDHQRAVEQKEADQRWQIELKAQDERQHEERRADDRKWEIEREKADREWREDQDRKTRQWQLKLAGIAASLAILSGSIVAFIGYMITPKPQPPVILQVPAGSKIDP